MVAWNPSFPEVLGLEWLVNIGHTGRVWAGDRALMARLPSTVAETINSLKLSATVNPLVDASIPTVVDIVEEGNEDVGLFQLASLVPNSDVTSSGWKNESGGTTNLFQSIDEDATRWPGPAQDTWIYTTSPVTVYTCSVNAAQFAGGGAQQNARIGWVAVQAILGANTGFRKLAVSLDLGGGTPYAPAGGSLREVHGYGSLFSFWWGELNPATSKPWTPADIANFGSAGTYRLRVRSHLSATSTYYPKVFALRLHVHYLTTENRVAVGVWRRPEAMADRLTNVTTDALVTVPAGTAGWSKASAKNYLFYWRQSVSPALYSAVVADDVRWNMAYQDLGPGGQPPGISFAPGGVLATRRITHDKYGRPAEAFPSTATAPHIGSAAGLAMVRSDVAISADSQPYRLDTADLAYVRSTQKLGQRVTPGSAQTYLGVRLPIIPPATGDPTLTVAVFRISDSVQMGGTFTITASAARALPAATGGWRYVTGFLSSSASLASGIAYEIRLTTSAGEWIAAMPDCSLGPTASFGGSTDGAFIGATHDGNRDLAVNLVRQPNPATGPSAATTDIAATTFSDQVTTIKHVLVSWTPPGSGMGGLFARYELERQLASGPWERIANILTASVSSFTDREAPRGVAATYRIRAVGTDGRFSAWATTGSVTPTDSRPMLILASNHRADLYFVHLYEITDPADVETVYPILSTERDEVVAVHGADYQVVFMEAEDRGVGWRTRVSLNQAASAAKGVARFDTLLDLVRALDIPYVCAMDHQGNRILGHVAVAQGTQNQPDYQYSTLLDIIPTHTEPVAAEVP